MIISHKFKYLYLEVPFTGTRAIGEALCKHYAGERILGHHSNYHEFVRIAKRHELDYFVFAGVRNPLDAAVSQFFKFRSTNEEEYLSHDRGNSIQQRIVRSLTLDKIRFIREHDSFEAFFKRYYRFPYDNWLSTCVDHCDFVMRFENLQKDFETVVSHLDAGPYIPPSHRGKTNSRDRTKAAAEYYSPEIRQRAIRVFGTYMKRFDYPLPSGWEKGNEVSNFLFNLLAYPRSFYWKHARAYLT